jgi:DNA-binding MarR family transcriptional regulator
MSVKPISPPPRPLPALLTEVKLAAIAKLRERIAEAGHPDIREGHGCVFGFIDLEHGSRLTDLAERSGLTKQAVGEAVAELERKGYLERMPDPEDGRAKIIKLNARGVEAALTGRRLFKEIEDEWGERYGEERVAILRECAEEIAAGYLGAAGRVPADQRRAASTGLGPVRADQRLTGATASPS